MVFLGLSRIWAPGEVVLSEMQDVTLRDIPNIAVLAGEGRAAIDFWNHDP